MFKYSRIKVLYCLVTLELIINLILTIIWLTNNKKYSHQSPPFSKTLQDDSESRIHFKLLSSWTGIIFQDIWASIHSQAYFHSGDCIKSICGFLKKNRRFIIGLFGFWRTSHSFRSTTKKNAAQNQNSLHQWQSKPFGIHRVSFQILFTKINFMGNNINISFHILFANISLMGNDFKIAAQENKSNLATSSGLRTITPQVCGGESYQYQASRNKNPIPIQYHFNPYQSNTTSHLIPSRSLQLCRQASHNENQNKNISSHFSSALTLP